MANKHFLLLGTDFLAPQPHLHHILGLSIPSVVGHKATFGFPMQKLNACLTKGTNAFVKDSTSRLTDEDFMTVEGWNILDPDQI